MNNYKEIPSYEPQENPEKIAQALSEKFQLELSSEHDDDLFLEAVAKLTKEFREANGEEARKILVDRFFDAFFPDEDAPYSEFYEEFAMRPIELQFSPGLELRQGGNTTLLDPKSEGYTLIGKVETKQYGPSTIHNVPPGTWMKTHLDEQDVIASTGFSCCRCVVGINKNGEAIFSHITTNWAEDEQLEKLKQTFGEGKLYFIYPFEELKPDAPADEVEFRDKRSDRYKSLAAKHGMEPLTYQEVSGREHALNRHDIRGTAIALTRSGIQMIGSDLKVHKNSNFFGPQPRTHILREETRQDIPF